MVKINLLEAQLPAIERSIPRLKRLRRGHQNITKKNWSSKIFYLIIYPELQQLIQKLYPQSLCHAIQTVYEDVCLKNLAQKHGEREGTVVCMPIYKQIYAFLKFSEQEPQVVGARSGIKHPLRGKTSRTSALLYIELFER